MKKSLKEIMEAFDIIVGDNRSDEVLDFVETLRDTYNMDGEEMARKLQEREKAQADMEAELNKRYDELKAMYNKLDSEWREKFYKKFFERDEDADTKREKQNVIEKDPEEITYEDIFTEEKKED